MKILVLGGDGYLGLAYGAAPVGGGPRGGRRRQFRPQALRQRARGRVAGADRAAADADRGMAGADRQADRAVRRGPDRRAVHVPHHQGLRAGGGGALRGAAGRAVLDDRPGARGVHPAEQRGREPERLVRDRRDQPGHPPGQARHDGRVRHAEHRHRGGLAGPGAQRPDRPGAVPQAAGLVLPPVQGARQPQHRVRLPDLGPAGHRPEPGRGLRPADRRRPRGTSGWRPGSTTTRCSAPC